MYNATVLIAHMYVEAVRERYSGAVAGPELDVTFVGEEIVLDLPKGGVTVNSNWTITPLSYPKVQKQLQFLCSDNCIMSTNISASYFLCR